MQNFNGKIGGGDGIYWIKEANQIRALESPMRQEIVDAVAALGPCSIVELADHLGRAADSLYFHVKKLVQVKLLLEQEKRKSGRHVWTIYALPGRQVRMVYRPALLGSIQRVVAGAMRLSLREFQQSVAQKGGEFAGPKRNIWGGRMKGWLTESDLQEVNQMLERILHLLSRHGPGPERRVHTLGWVLAPAQVRARAQRHLSRKGRAQ
jgi:hypothetical protein